MKFSEANSMMIRTTAEMLSLAATLMMTDEKKNRYGMTGRGNPKYLEKPPLQCHVSTTNPK